MTVEPISTGPIVEPVAEVLPAPTGPEPAPAPEPVLEPLTPLAQLALQAYQDAEAARQAEVDAAWTQQHAAATAAVKAVLGTVTMTEVGLTKRDENRERPTVVWSDGQVHLAAQPEPDGTWQVKVVERVDDAWEDAGRPVGTLAQLGAVLAADRDKGRA